MENGPPAIVVSALCMTANTTQPFCWFSKQTEREHAAYGRGKRRYRCDGPTESLQPRLIFPIKTWTINSPGKHLPFMRPCTSSGSRPRETKKSLRPVTRTDVSSADLDSELLGCLSLEPAYKPASANLHQDGPMVSSKFNTGALFFIWTRGRFAKYITHLPDVLVSARTQRHTHNESPLLKVRLTYVRLSSGVPPSFTDLDTCPGLGHIQRH